MIIHKRVKVIFMLVVVVLSLVSVLIIIITTFTTINEKKVDINDYEIKTEVVNTKPKSLASDVIYKSIDSKHLVDSIIIKSVATTKDDATIVVTNQPVFNVEKLQYLFIKQFIKSFPQWKTNKLVFSYNDFYNKAWVRYEIDNDSNYLSWIFTINSKILS